MTDNLPGYYQTKLELYADDVELPCSKVME